MPSLDEHQSSLYAKVMYIGDSGTGKTGSLVSLLEAGYKFRVMDMDNGLDSLVAFARRSCPDKLRNVEYETIRDKYKATSAGLILAGPPKAYTDALKKLTEWSSIEDDMTITVVDSLSTMGRAAFEWAKGMNPSSKDPRQWYNTAQRSIEDMIALLTSGEYKQNVIVISHVNYREVTEGVQKGYASAIGTALGPIIPKYFNTLILAESIGAGKNVRRRIKTVPTGIIDLKTPLLDLDIELPLESGLATIFAKMKEPTNA